MAAPPPLGWLEDAAHETTRGSLEFAIVRRISTGLDGSPGTSKQAQLARNSTFATNRFRQLTSWLDRGRNELNVHGCSLHQEGHKMGRDELTRLLREYANEHHPGWDVASIMVSRGPGREPEAILVTPASAPSLPAESPH